MASWKDPKASFSLSGVRERMWEKKNGALRTAKLNASLASKIKTKIINNSSTFKISLKHNNKALALALNAAKVSVQQLTQEKMLLRKEVDQCHIQNALLQHRLSFLNDTMTELEKLLAAVKMACLPEFRTSSASLSNGQKTSMTEDSWFEGVADGQLLRAAGMPLRVPISRLREAGQQGCSSTAVQTSSLDLQRPASNELLEIVPVASKDTLPPAEQPQSHEEENGKMLTGTMEAQEAFVGSCLFGEALCTTQQDPNNLPALAWESHPLSDKGNEMAKHFFDRLSQGHVTQRRKRSTLFATGTPSSVVDIVPQASSTQVARWSITEESSSSSKSNTQPQQKSPSSLISPTQTTVVPDGRSLANEIFCDQPQAKETGCGVETDLRYSRVPEFVPVKVKRKDSGKTGGKKTVKKASTGGKNPNAIKNYAESSYLPQDENSAQNANKLLHPKVAKCSIESEVFETGQNACAEAFNRKNRSCGVEQDSCSAAEVQDLRRTNVVDPAQLQLQSCQSHDLQQQVMKRATCEIQIKESSSKSPVGTFSNHEVPSDDLSLQNALFLRKETSSTCALEKDSSRSTKSMRQKTNRRTRVIRQKDKSEEHLPNSVTIPGANAEEQPKKSQSESPFGTFSNHEVPSGESSLQNGLFLRKETASTCALQEDSDGSAKIIRQKANRRTRVISQRDEAEENLLNSVKISGAKDEQQPKRSLMSRKKTVRKSSCNDQKNEVDFGPCKDVQEMAKESTKDSLCNPRSIRKTYIVHPLDLAGNLGCVQTDFEGGEIVPHMSIAGRKPSKIPRLEGMGAAQSNKKQTEGLQEKQQARADNVNALKKEAYPKLKCQWKRNTSSPPKADSFATQSDGTKALIGSSAEPAYKQTAPTGKFSWITNLSEPDALLKEQIADISLENNLMDVSHCFESSSAALSVSSQLTDVAGSKSLSTEGNRMPEKLSIGLESSLIFKEMPAEEIPGETNQAESSSRSSPPQEPDIMPLQDLTNTRTLPSSCSEVLGRPSRQRRDPPSYAEPKINRKLRRGDPFTDMEFLHSPTYKTKKKKSAQAQRKTKKINKEKELLSEGCSSTKSQKLIMGNDMDTEVK
ncbi:shugoshin 2-like [Phaenicophaeus curvirostris]|uniref:shugoshin 2-like n=1 Tax=Phaenicophaeus curvirostris TaxID=33595 RepID=UPI0037F0CDA6